MKQSDLLNFAKSTTAVLANFGAIATEPLLNLWFEAAREDKIAIEQWESAAKKIIRGRKYTSQPTYADFYETIFGSPVTETDRAGKQVTVVMMQIRELGSYRTPCFDDSVTKTLMSSRWSWQAVCTMTEYELKWWAKEFIESYQAVERTGNRSQIGSGGSDERKLKLLVGGIGGKS